MYVLYGWGGETLHNYLMNSGDTFFMNMFYVCDHKLAKNIGPINSY